MLNIFSKKFNNITLSKALELKDQIQDKLKSNHVILKLENSVLKDQKRNYNLKKIVKESTELQEKLVTLKILIQEANLQVLPDQEYCISRYVYSLSEKKTQILNLLSMRDTAFEGPGTDKKGNSVHYAKPVYTRPEIEDWVNKLKKECSEIESKLTELNNLIIVGLPFKI